MPIFWRDMKWAATGLATSRLRVPSRTHASNSDLSRTRSRKSGPYHPGMNPAKEPGLASPPEPPGPWQEKHLQRVASATPRSAAEPEGGETIPERTLYAAV